MQNKTCIITESCSKGFFLIAIINGITAPILDYLSHLQHIITSNHSFRNISKAKLNYATFWCCQMLFVLLGIHDCHFKNMNWVIRIPSFDLLIHVTQRKVAHVTQICRLTQPGFNPGPKAYYHYTATITVTLLKLSLVFKVDRGNILPPNFTFGFWYHTSTTSYDMMETKIRHTAQCWLAIKSNPMKVESMYS